MKRIRESMIVGFAGAALALPSPAAPVTWGAAAVITASTDIQTTGVTNLAGADFGLTNGTTTTVNNGAGETGGTNVAFKSLLYTQTVTLTNGITVTPTNFQFNNNAGNGTIGGNYGAILGRHSGAFSNGGTIVLSGLTTGTKYQLQVFCMGGDTANVSIAGSPALAVGGGNNAGNSSGFGATVVGTFTADATTQTLTLTANTGEPTINALTIGTAPADATPPAWTATWPQVTPLSTTSLTVNAKTNEAGKAYYVVLADGAAAPTAAQVKAGTDSGGTPVSASGSMVLSANAEATTTVGSLSPGTAYDVYFVAEDGVPNLQASPVKVDASTLTPDTTPPEWIATWPQAAPLSTTSLTVRAKTGEAGAAYYVVLPDGAPAPTSSQVKAGTDSADVPVSDVGNLPLTANTEAAATVGWLSPGTAYDVYFVAEDGVPNLQVAPVKVDVSTLPPDTAPPEWIATWPQAAPLSSTSLSVRTRTNEAGAAYYVVLPDGATAPSAAQVMAGTDSANNPVSASGTMPLNADTEATAQVGGFNPGTDYDVYFVAEDLEFNLQAAPAMVDVSTLPPDITPPAWIETWPKAGQLSGTSITVRAQTNETGAAYYVVLAAGAPAPSADQVKAGTDSADAPALRSGTLSLTANTETTAAVTGLTTDTGYDIYFVAQDAVPNLQAAPSLVSVFLVAPAVLWGDWTGVSDNTAIQVLGGYSTVQGVNLNGSDTLINNGTVDVSFIGIAQNASGTAAGITVSTSGFNFQSTGNNSNVSSAVGSPQTWGTVLDRVIGDDGVVDAAITLSGLTPGRGYYVQFFSSAPDANILSASKLTSRGVDSPFFGSHPNGGTRYIIATFNADAASQTFTLSGTEPTYSALVIGVKPASNSYANWIGGYDNLNGLTGFNDDADGDGLDNGLENFLGTAPNAGNAGLTAGTPSGNTFTFTHPQNATPASDVSAPAYTWSTDLVNWNASGASAGGITVTLAAVPNSPSPTTVTATVTGTMPPKLFVRLGVSQE